MYFSGSLAPVHCHEMYSHIGMNSPRTFSWPGQSFRHVAVWSLGREGRQRYSATWSSVEFQRGGLRRQVEVMFACDCCLSTGRA